MNKKTQNIFYIFVIAYLILMCFSNPEYQIGFIISIIFIIVLWTNNYFEFNDIDKLLKIKLNHNCLEIINKQECIRIPISDIKSCESIIYANSNTARFICYGLYLRHKFIIHTNSNELEFEFPEKTRVYYRSGGFAYADYDEIFDLIDLNLPNYKYTFIGNIEHIQKDIDYYSKYHIRENLIKRYFLYFSDLPLLSKLRNILCIMALILFIFVILFQVLLYLIPFLRNHGIFF